MKQFLYLLLRDHLPAGVVESIMMDVRACKGKEVTFSNGPLAQYAEELANELRVMAGKSTLFALKKMTERYVELANSGDCGHWDPEKEEVVMIARKTIAQAEGQI